VGHQTFADAVVFESDASGFFSDNKVNLGLQADLNGRVWAIDASDVTSREVLIDASAKVDQSQPLYYPPAVGGFEPGTGVRGTTGCNVYAFASGTYYERSPAITGQGVGTDDSKYFSPTLFMASDTKLRTAAKSQVPSGNIIPLKLSGFICYIKDKDGILVKTHTLSPNSQVTAPPFLLIDPKGLTPATAVYVVYDPDEGCNGETYVIVMNLAIESSCAPVAIGSTGTGGGGGGGTGGGGGGGTGGGGGGGTGGGGGGGGGTGGQTTTVDSFDAGAGAASGAVIAGDKILVIKSGVGEEKAGVFEPPNIKAAIGNPATPRPLWWREIK
jgi:hypothetical protein